MRILAGLKLYLNYRRLLLGYVVTSRLKDDTFKFLSPMSLDSPSP